MAAIDDLNGAVAKLQNDVALLQAASTVHAGNTVSAAQVEAAVAQVNAANVQIEAVTAVLSV